MSPYEALSKEAQPGVVLDEAIDYALNDAQKAALSPEARIGLVIVSEVMQKSFENLEDITTVLIDETGLGTDVLVKARHSLAGSRGSERMRLDKTDGFRLLLTARGLEFLDGQVAHVKKNPAETNGNGSAPA